MKAPIKNNKVIQLILFAMFLLPFTYASAQDQHYDASGVKSEIERDNKESKYNKEVKQKKTKENVKKSKFRKRGKAKAVGQKNRISKGKKGKQSKRIKAKTRIAKAKTRTENLRKDGKLDNMQYRKRVHKIERKEAKLAQIKQRRMLKQSK